MTSPEPVVVRVARPSEYDRVAEITVGVYAGEGLVDPGGNYVEVLADVAGRAAHTEVLVATSGAEILGCVALAFEGRYAEDALSTEAVFRMLAVDANARGRGVGEALVRACLQRATDAGKRGILISTQPNMVAAHRLYARLGFRRRPERDWEPEPDYPLWRYTFALR